MQWLIHASYKCEKRVSLDMVDVLKLDPWKRNSGMNASEVSGCKDRMEYLRMRGERERGGGNHQPR